MTINQRDLAKMIDHSLLHPTMTDDEMQRGCELADRYQVASVCIKPYAVKQAAVWLADSEVLVGTVIGFPHGNSPVNIKVAETQQACQDGAIEIDMVVNIGKVLSGDWGYVTYEIDAINDAVVANDRVLKVIFENDYLKPEHIKKLCEICNAIHVAFVKTSTGYGFVKQANGMYSYQGAVADDLILMRETAKKSIEIKAAGGIRTLDDLLAVRKLGVTRVGATATAEILDEAQRRLDQGIALA